MVEVQLEHFGADAEEVMTIRNGSFSWSRNQGKPTLHDINVVVPKGKLIAIVGSVGVEAGRDGMAVSAGWTSKRQLV